MRSLFSFIGVLVFLLFGCGTAYAFETHASILAGTGYNYFEENSYVKGGIVLSAPIKYGFGWWSYTGVGNTAKDETWACHQEGLDWSYQRLTSSFTYKISKDPDHFSDPDYALQHEVGVGVKVKLW
jgi:hypothetical protein